LDINPAEGWNPIINGEHLGAVILKQGHVAPLINDSAELEHHLMD